MRAFLAFGLAFALALLPGIPALALSPAGSHGWSRAALVLHSGPGDHYPVTGEIAGKLAIKILRCQKLWCNVDGPGGRGWTRNGAIDFGKDPAWPLLDPTAPRPDLSGGEMCFYEGSHFSGRSFCAATGQVFPDLAMLGWDNRIGSVRVVTGTSAAVCRDRFFQSYCERIAADQPVLNRFLSRNVSSIRLY